jgi:FtsH-binding integral membrane protein
MGRWGGMLGGFLTMGLIGIVIASLVNFLMLLRMFGGGREK